MELDEIASHINFWVFQKEAEVFNGIVIAGRQAIPSIWCSTEKNLWNSEKPKYLEIFKACYKEYLSPAELKVFDWGPKLATTVDATPERHIQHEFHWGGKQLGHVSFPGISFVIPYYRLRSWTALQNAGTTSSYGTMAIASQLAAEADRRRTYPSRLTKDRNIQSTSYVQMKGSVLMIKWNSRRSIRRYSIPVKRMRNISYAPHSFLRLLKPLQHFIVTTGSVRTVPKRHWKRTETGRKCAFSRGAPDMVPGQPLDAEGPYFIMHLWGPGSPGLSCWPVDNVSEGCNAHWTELSIGNAMTTYKRHPTSPPFV